MRIIATFLILIAALQLSAQDAIVTQKFNNPLFVNPALTGNGDKVNRLTFLYRDQWRSVVVPYSTTYLGYDRQMLKRNNNMIAAGLQFFYDKAASGTLSTFNPTISMSYTRFLKQEKIALSGGIQMGYLQTNVDASSIEFNSQYGPNGFDPTISSGESFENGSFVTFALGGNVNAVLYGKSNIDVGFAIHNPHKPTYDFSAYLGDARPARYSAYFNSEFFTNSQISLSPAFYFNTQETAKEFHTSVRLNYYTKSEKTPVKLSVGGGYRNNDAVLTYIGAEVKDFIFGFSYDVNTSSFEDATNKKGGFELSLQYGFERKKKDKTIEIDTSDVIDSLLVEEEDTIIEDTIEQVIEEVTEVEVVETVEPEITEPVEVVEPIEEIAPIVEALPLQLFFDNNQPAPNTNYDYETYFNNYLARKTEYASKIGVDATNEWFSKVNAAKDLIDDVVNQLETIATKGYTVELTLKGYASPLASADYNAKLASRRIAIVVNTLKTANNGVLSKWFEDGTIKIIEAPIGESNSPTGINDDLSNKTQSIYSTQAAFERRVEIIAVDIEKK